MRLDGKVAIKGDLYFYSEEHDMRETVNEIDTQKVPLYLLTGEYDYLSTPAQTQATAEKISGAMFEVTRVPDRSALTVLAR
jgi:hypothetical protein